MKTPTYPYLVVIDGRARGFYKDILTAQSRAKAILQEEDPFALALIYDERGNNPPEIVEL